MCRLRNIAMRDYQESVTTGKTHTHTDGRTDRRCQEISYPGELVTRIIRTQNEWVPILWLIRTQVRINQRIRIVRGPVGPTMQPPGDFFHGCQLVC